jgi:hypothetical protein
MERWGVDVFLRQLLRQDMGCASYVVGSVEAGVCAVVDPVLDAQAALDTAQAAGMRIGE